MKNSNTNLFYKAGATGLLFLTIFLLINCGKDDHTEILPPSKIALMHASPGDVAYDISMNGRRLNQQALNYDNYIDYRAESSGKSEFSISQRGSHVVLNRSLFSLKPYTIYSIYITNVTAKVSLFLTEDTTPTPIAGKARLRFINLSPDAGSLNLNIFGEATNLVANTSFKSGSEFIQVNCSTGIGFTITDSTNSTVLATSVKYKIDQGKAYTIIAKGLKYGNESSRLAIGMIKNE